MEVPQHYVSIHSRNPVYKKNPGQVVNLMAHSSGKQVLRLHGIRLSGNVLEHELYLLGSVHPSPRTVTGEAQAPFPIGLDAIVFNYCRVTENKYTA